MPKIACNIIEVCVFSFENKEPLYLMLRRSLTEPLYPNTWQIVTGSIETGETAQHAALRELKEETGYSPKKLWIVPLVNTFFSVRHDTVNHTVIFAAQIDSAVPVQLSDEHYQFGWYTVEQAKEKCVWPGQKKALAIVHDYIVGGKEAAALSEITV